MVQPKQNKYASRLDYLNEHQENIFYPESKKPARKPLLSMRTILIYSFTGLCFLLFIQAGMRLIMKTTGILPVSNSTPSLTPTQVSPKAEKIAMIVPRGDISKCVPERIDQERGSVVAVIAGDTIDVQFADGSVQRVHYIGLTPDGDTDHSNQASAENAQLVDGKDVVLVRDVTDKDLYGRLLRYVFVGDTFLNYELIAQGWALLESFPPDTACADNFRTAQQQAAAAGLGIWAGASAGSNTQ